MHKHTTPSISTSAISAGTATIRPSSASRPARRSSSTRWTPRGASSPPDSTVADIARLDFAKVNPVAGPIYIDGAEPGDAIKVTLLSFAPSGWGWTANIPGFGLLADQFKDPALHIWKYDAEDAGAGHVWSRRPRAAQTLLRHHRPCARRAGPALDRSAAAHGRQHGHPRHAPPARSSICRSRWRAACSASATPMRRQGDGEVCGTAIESPCSLAAQVRAREGREPRLPALHHAGTGRAPPRRARAMRSRPASVPI